MNKAFLDYFKCPSQFARFEASGDLGRDKEFFGFGNGVLYGRTITEVCADARGEPRDVSSHAAIGDGSVSLPFDANEVADNLRFERYVRQHRTVSQKLVRHAYYKLRPALPVSIRKYLQRIHLRDRLKLPFPQWPIDNTVDRVFQDIMAMAVKAHHREIPFIWFWPDAYESCYIMTHDVEHESGRAFCLELLRLDDEYGIKASLQLVPEERYVIEPQFRKAIEDAGFEVNVHDLNHDGHLFENRQRFLRQAVKINSYGKAWGAKGFRSGAMYRNADWLDDLMFSYDMSMPNAAHFEPQRGGCCTIMPFQVGGTVELPLTTTQDYTLFHVLSDYSIDLWTQQIEYLNKRHGLISFIIHPDYVIERRARHVYTQLLARLAEVRQTRRVWQTLPREVAQWWKLRSALELKYEDRGWTISGPGAERAGLAFATVINGQLQYRMASTLTSG